MAKEKKQVSKAKTKRRFKRERRQRLIIYLMVIAMLLSVFTAGLAGIALL